MKHTVVLPRTANHPLYQLSLPVDAVRGRLFYDVRRLAGQGYDVGGFWITVTPLASEWASGTSAAAQTVLDSLGSFTYEPDDTSPQHRVSGAIALPDLLYPRVDVYAEVTNPAGPLFDDLDTRLVLVYET